MFMKKSAQQKRSATICRQLSGRLLIVVLFTACLLSGSITAMAQEKQVSGRVTTEGGTAVVGASVTIKGTSTGTTTDGAGDFRINAAKGVVLIISNVGFIAKEVTAGDGNTLEIQLALNATDIGEVVVVG